MERKLLKREDARKSLVSLLLPHKDGLDINQLDSEYEAVVGGHIPWKDLGHFSLKNFLISISESIEMKQINGKLIVKGIPSDKSKHIRDFVVAQKDPKPHTRRKGFRSSHYFPNTAPPRNQLPAKELTHTIYQWNDMVYPMKNVITKSNVQSCNDTPACEVFAAGNEYESYESEDYIDNVSESAYPVFTKKSMDETNDGKYGANQQILINNRLKNRLKKLVEKHLDGMWCAELPNKYLEEYRVHLRYTELGFDSIIEFVEQLPDIFRCIKYPGAVDFRIYDAKRPLPKMGYKTEEMNIASCKTLSTVTPKRSMISIPDEVMGIGDQIDFVNVEDLKQGTESFHNVIVVEVFKPTFFWVQLYEKRQVFERFNENLHDYYKKNSDYYKIPADVLKKGLYCTCVYDEIWYRGIIIDMIEPDNIKVGFIDYGTLKTYSRDSVYYLNKMFSTLPAQAIACSLYNVRPYRVSMWTTTATYRFTEKTFQKPLVAIIVQTDKEDNMMKISLADTSEDDDLHINDWMVHENIASYGKIVHHKRQNFLFQCFLENQKLREPLISHDSSPVRDEKSSANAEEPNNSNGSSNEEKESNLTTKCSTKSPTTLKNLFRHLQNAAKIKLKHEAEIKNRLMSTKDLGRDETPSDVPPQYAMHFDVKDPDDVGALDWKNYNQQRDTSFTSSDWSHAMKSKKCDSEILDDKVPKIGKNVPLAESNFLKAVYDSSYGPLHDKDIPWSPSGNVSGMHDGTLKDKSCNTSKSDDSSCEINRIAADNSNYTNDSKLCTATEKVNEAKRPDLSYISKSDNEISESNKNDFFNMTILRPTQKLQSLKHDMNSYSVIDSDDLSTLNESIAYFVDENIPKQSYIEIGSNKCFEDSIKADTENLSPKRRFKFPVSNLNVARMKASTSSSEILTSTNDSDSVIALETKNSNFIKDIGTAYLPHSVDAGTTDNSESDAQSQGVVEILTEGELIQKSEIPVFNDVDLESCGDEEWDVHVPDPLNYLRNNLCFNTVTKNLLTEGATITEITDSNEVEI